MTLPSQEDIDEILASVGAAPSSGVGGITVEEIVRNAQASATTMPPIEGDPTRVVQVPPETKPILPIPEDWDYKTAQAGPHGEALPKGAKGWTPYGTPYWGEGIEAIGKRYTWIFNDKTTAPPTEEEWDAWLQEAPSMLLNVPLLQSAAEGDLQGVWDATKAQFSRFGTALELLGREAGALSEDAGVFRPVTQGLKVGLTALSDLFQQPAIGVERAIGAYKGTVMTAAEIRADQIEANPDDNMFEGLVRRSFIPLLQEKNFDKIELAMKEGWQSGRILYSSVFDKTLEAEFLRRYRAGEDPALLAMELQNPIVEAIGQGIGDPLNFVNWIGKGLKWAGVLDDSMDTMKATGTLADVKIAKIIDDFQPIAQADDVLAAEKKAELVSASMKADEAIREGKLLKQSYSPFVLMSTSRAEVLLKKSADYIGVVINNFRQQGYGSAQMVDFFRYGIKSVSRNADEVAEGIDGLLHIRGARTAFSELGRQTFIVMRNLITNANGGIDFSRLERMGEIGEFDKFVEASAGMLAAATQKAFPSITDMRKAYELSNKAKKGGKITEGTQALAKQYENLLRRNPSAAYFARFAEGPEKTKKAINTGLGTFYFSLQGGVAVKNWLNNTETLLIDLGTGAFYKNGKFWSTAEKMEVLEDWVGFKPISAAGFTTQLGAEGLREFKWWQLGSKLMDRGEQSAGIRAVSTAFETGMRKLLKPILKDTSELRAVGMTSRETKYLQDLFFAKRGKTDEILNAFRAKFGESTVEEWRLLEFVKEGHRRGFEEMGLWREIEKMAETAQTPEKVQAGFTKLRKAVAERARFANKDVPGLSLAHSDAADLMTKLRKAADAGDAGEDAYNANTKLTVIIEAGYQARDEYLQAMQGFLKKYPDPSLQQQWIGVLTDFTSGGKVIAHKTSGIVDFAWKINDKIKDAAQAGKVDLLGLWNEAGLGLRNGAPPLDLDVKILLNTLWDDARAQTALEWENYFDSIYAKSEGLLEGAAKLANADDLEATFERSRRLAAQAEIYRTAGYHNGEFRVPVTDDIRKIGSNYGIPTATAEGKPSDRNLLNTINKYAGTKYTSIDEIDDPKIVTDALEKRRIEKGLAEVPQARATASIPPPYPTGSTPSIARAWSESGEFLTRALDETEKGILGKWGQTFQGGLDDVKEAALLKYVQDAAPKVAEAKIFALKAAEYWRDFILHDYGKRTYADAALSYILPYHFWYGRTYANWMQRVVTDPQVIANYARYKEAMSKLHADMPEWYRYNVVINPKDILGIDYDHPFYFNLEAAINPLYGITSPDFNDPEKRFDTASRTLDDLSKFGPSVWSPLQIGMAVYASAKGEAEAARHWAGRIIPETAALKGLSSIFGKPIELDPAVLAFNGMNIFTAKDPFEERRIGNSAVELTQMGYSEDEVFNQVANQSGSMWDLAYQMSTRQRAPSLGLSWLLGVGFKARTPADLEIERMYTDIGGLYQQSVDMPAEDVKQAWDELRERYPNMDLVLMSRKTGDLRDAALIYNVLGRIPPGDTKDLMEMLGVRGDSIDRFYKDRGNMSKWTPGDRERFMGAVFDMSAILYMPSDANREEWTAVKSMYQDAQKIVSENLGIPYANNGRGVWDIVDQWNELEGRDKQTFWELHPEIQAAFDLQNQYLANTPLLYKYYGSLQVLDSYARGKQREFMTAKYGENIYDLQAEYYALGDKYGYNDDLVKKAQKQFKKDHPELMAFWKESSQQQDILNRSVVRLAELMPPAPVFETREPRSPTQEMLVETLNNRGGIDVETVMQSMSPELMEVITAWASQGGELPYAARQQLDYIAGLYNLNTNELLQLLLMR